MNDPEVVLDGLTLPEGPRWHDGALWLSDIRGGRVLKLHAGDHVEVVTDAIDFPSGLGFLPDGDPIVVAMREKRVYRLTPHGPVVHAELGQFASGMLNDMIVDSRGNAWVDANGHSFFGGEVPGEPTPDGLVLVTPDGSATLAAEGLVSPNGVALTPDERTLISAESGGRRLSAFDVAPDGSLSRKRVFAELGNVVPDGICLDAEGAVWVASPITSEFVRVREGGEVLERIPVPERIALACTLGAEDRRTLYLTTAAPADLNMLREGTTKGRVERVRVDVPGAGRP